MYYANQWWRSEEKDEEEEQFAPGKRVYLLMKNLALPKERASKLLPKYVESYKIVKAYPRSSSYKLELLKELRDCQIHPRFHISLLKEYIPNDEQLFPNWEPKVYYDFGTPDKVEWLVDGILEYEWRGKQVWFHVQWNLGDFTWEPVEVCNELEAVDRYLELIRVDNPSKLPQKPRGWGGWESQPRTKHMRA